VGQTGNGGQNWVGQTGNGGHNFNQDFRILNKAGVDWIHLAPVADCCEHDCFVTDGAFLTDRYVVCEMDCAPSGRLFEYTVALFEFEISCC
jgi:hypothetical protein